MPVIGYRVFARVTSANEIVVGDALGVARFNFRHDTYILNPSITIESVCSHKIGVVIVQTTGTVKNHGLWFK